MSSSSPQPDIYPVLFYRDAAAAIEWLIRVFGFTRRMTVPDQSGGIMHAELTLGSSVVMVSSVRPDRHWFSPREAGGVTNSICIYLVDPDAHHARSIQGGAEILLPLVTKDYGARDYTCRDLEGHVWTFGTYRPGEYWEK